VIVADDAEWKLVADLIHDRFGLAFDGVRRDFLASRLVPRLRQLRLCSLAEYYHYLLFHPERHDEDAFLRQAATNNETYFFREAYQLELLARHVAPLWVARLGGRPLRVLSAGCSSGEEAYSIAITLAERGPPGAAVQVDGVDLSPARIAQAQRAVYGEPSLRACDADARRRYFEPLGDGGFALRPRWRAGVRCREANLLALPDLGVYHAIFCRNVLIYFSERTLHAAVSALLAHLADGGTLFLGHSESLINKRAELEALCVRGTVIYRKRGAAAGDTP
jgi:chemotaxis protein methyltransferase CheR